MFILCFWKDLKISCHYIYLQEIEYEETERAAPGEHQDKDGTDQTNNAAQGDKAPDAEKKVEKVAILNLLSYQSRGRQIFSLCILLLINQSLMLSRVIWLLQASPSSLMPVY